MQTTLFIVKNQKFSSATIKFKLINDDTFERSEEFYIELGQPIWHKERQKPLAADEADGSPILGDHTRCKIVIIEDDKFKANRRSPFAFS